MTDGGSQGVRGRSDFSVTAAAVPSLQGGAKRATTGSEEEEEEEEKYEYDEYRDEMERQCERGTVGTNFCVLPSIRAINMTTNAEETVLTRRRILPEDEASEQNHGYLHSRLITLPLLPRSLLLTSHLSALTCHLQRATSSVLLFRNLSRIFKQWTFLLSLRSSFT